jgi:hypothetical protein
VLNSASQFFMGYRYGLFDRITQALGGAVADRRFALTTLQSMTSGEQCRPHR